MDAPCKIQGSIHVFRLVNNMCPGKWVHIILSGVFPYMTYERIFATELVLDMDNSFIDVKLYIQ